MQHFLHPRIAVSIGVALVLASGVASALDAQPDPRAPGRDLFNRTCGNSHCHGTDGHGAGAPTLSGRVLPPLYIMEVLSKGIPGTRMPSFANVLSSDEISQLVVFLTGHSPPPATDVAPVASKPPAAIAAPLAAAEARGERLFFDLSHDERCSACHTYFGRGGTAAADLTDAAAWPASRLLKAVADLAPTHDGKSRAVAIQMRDGTTQRGLLEAADDHTVRIADVSMLPVVHRQFSRAEIATMAPLAAAALPAHAMSRLAPSGQADVVAYLRSFDGAHVAPSGRPAVAAAGEGK